MIARRISDILFDAAQRRLRDMKENGYQPELMVEYAHISDRAVVQLLIEIRQGVEPSLD